MLVKGLKDYDKSKAVFPALVSPKLDGVRGKKVKRGIISRRGNIIHGLGHILKQLKNPRHKFDGELTIPGKDFESASGLVRNHQNIPEAVYNIIDLPSNPMSKKYRDIILRKWFSLGPVNSSIRLIPTYPVKTHGELMFYYHVFLGQGFEGLVYYNPDSLYTNTENYDWMRLVPLKSADCEVIGFYEGEDGFEGILGGIIVKYKDKICRVGTGFKLNYSDDYPDEYVRDYIWNNQSEFLGIKAECVFKLETKYGNMRQPRFKGWRWDK